MSAIPAVISEDDLNSYLFKNKPLRTFFANDGSILFMLVDICQTLSIANASDTLKQLDDDDKVTLAFSEGGVPRNFVTESGFYSLVLRSNKPLAKPFQKWVTGEVLPAIRKSGSYEIIPVEKFQIPQSFSEALRLAADQQEIIAAQAKQIEESKPALVVYESLANRRMDCNTTTLAKQLGTTATKLNTFLKDRGVKFKHQDLPMATHSEWFNVVTGVAKNGYETIQCLITPDGQIEIAKLWGEK